MKRKRISADEAYIRMTEALAQRSTCLDKQVGCVIVNSQNKIIATGYNGAPRGHTHCIDTGLCDKDHYRDANRCLSAHAEQNALLQCRVPEQIHTIYVNLSPCISCIRIIMNTPCERIVFSQEHLHPEAEKMWKGKWVHYAIP